MAPASKRIECDDVTSVVAAKKPRVVALLGCYYEVPPPSDLLSGSVGKLLVEKKQNGADVTFKVRDESFHVHKAVLAKGSPVFHAQLYGPLMEGSKDITVEDMHPDAFRALLYFIYTGAMPTMRALDDDDDRTEMIKHLLVAADRYAVGILKGHCESVLGQGLDAENVATMLALADQYHCVYLRRACVRFVALRCKIDDVVATQGYVDLKKSCPAVLVEMMEDVIRRGCNRVSDL